MESFVIEQGKESREAIPEGSFATLGDAQKALNELESVLGWRDLRIVREKTVNNVVVGKEVVEYGLESSETNAD